MNVNDITPLIDELSARIYRIDSTELMEKMNSALEKALTPHRVNVITKDNFEPLDFLTVLGDISQESDVCFYIFDDPENWYVETYALKLDDAKKILSDLEAELPVAEEAQT